MDSGIYMIFYDRGYRAQDNGEYLCRWVMENHPEIKTGYILDHTSTDWSRLKRDKFNLIDNLDKKYTHDELKKCTHACSSIFNEGINLNFGGCNCKRIFLNHGCFLVPINYIKDECDCVDLFIAANQIEYETLLNPFHKLLPEQVALCGQPRQDQLIKAQNKPHVENSILIQFWQRPWEWTKHENQKFLSSDFYKKTCALLSDRKLLDTCRRNNLIITFKMHPCQYGWLKYYDKFKNDVVYISDNSKPFEPEFIKSKLFITDISSNAYEIAKIGKPCIYFEPDAEELFGWRFKRNGGFEFDLEHNSIGPVIYSSVEMLVNKIISLIENNYALDQIYLDRRAQQISFLNDTNNCERCFEAILNSKNICESKKQQKLQYKKEKIYDSNNALPALSDFVTWRKVR